MDLLFENVYSALTKSRFLKEHCFCSQLANPSLAGDSSRLHLFVSLSLLRFLNRAKTINQARVESILEHVVNAKKLLRTLMKEKR